MKSNKRYVFFKMVTATRGDVAVALIRSWFNKSTCAMQHKTNVSKIVLSCCSSIL